MSQENFEQFQTLVLSDSALQNRLRSIAERPLFDQRVIELGAECGFELKIEDIETAMRQSRRAWLERWI